MTTFLEITNQLLPLAAALVAFLLWIWRKFSAVHESLSELRLELARFMSTMTTTVAHAERDLAMIKQTLDQRYRPRTREAKALGLDPEQKKRS